MIQSFPTQPDFILFHPVHLLFGWLELSLVAWSILKLKRVGNTGIKVGRFSSMGGQWSEQNDVHTFKLSTYFYDSDLLRWFIHVSSVSLILSPLWATMQQDSPALPRSPKIILSSLPEFPCCVRLRPGVVVCISNMRNDSEAFGDKQGTMRNDNLPCGSILTSSNKRNKQFQDKLFDARFIRSLLSRWELSETRVLSWIYNIALCCLFAKLLCWGYRVTQLQGRYSLAWSAKVES